MSLTIGIQVTLSQQRKLLQILWHLSSKLTKWFLIVSHVVSATSSLPLKVLYKVSSLVLPWKSPIIKCPHVSSSSFQLYMTDPGLTIKKVPDTLQMLSFWKKIQDLVQTNLIIIILLLSPFHRIHLILSYAHCLNCCCHWVLEKYIKNNIWACIDVEFLSKCSTRYVTSEHSEWVIISSWTLGEKFHISKQPCISLFII